MEIIIGKNAGFCYGVKRAVDFANIALKECKEKIYCLGEIVHNKGVVQELQNNGINFIENIEEADSTTIIRAHGVPREVYEIAKKNNIKLLDYTCPNVLKIHQIAEEYAQKGFFIILLGSDSHPENIGTSSFCGEKYIISQNETEILSAIEIIKKTKQKRVLVISQTTFSLKEFYCLTEILKENLNQDAELTIKNTICNSTETRQKEVENLSKRVDVMIIIGGKNSSNTRKLFDIATAHCNNAILIENKEELEKIKFNCEKIGIMAGASTPQEDIDEVVDFLQS